MANTLLTDSVITKEALLQLKNALGFSGSVNRQYDDRFANEGAKIGSSIQIRKPSRYEVTDGATYTAQDSVDQSSTLTLDTQQHVGLSFSSKELTMDIESFSDRYIKPACVALANKIDYSGLALYKKVHSAVGVPSASAFPSSLKGFLQAQQKLAEMGAPLDTYQAIINPATQASMVNGLSGLFQSSEQIAQQYEKGVMGMAAGSKFRMSQNVNAHTIGALGGTPLMNGATSSGATSIVTDGWTNSVTGVVKEGDVISIAGVYAVNPQTRQSTGSLAQFVVTADANSSGGGAATISIYPAIVSSGQYQTVNALPADNAAITIFGHASSYAAIVCPQNLVFHKDAFVLGMADLILPKGTHMAARANDPDAGLSIRLVSDYDVDTDKVKTRLDVLYGWKCVYPELACRVVGQPA